jgi:hypothetical protein
MNEPWILARKTPSSSEWKIVQRDATRQIAEDAWKILTEHDFKWGHISKYAVFHEDYWPPTDGQANEVSLDLEMRNLL